MPHDIPYRNPSGCSDPTAYSALSAIQSDQDEPEQRVSRLIKAVKYIIDLAGFDLVARIELRDRHTGRIYS